MHSNKEYARKIQRLIREKEKTSERLIKSKSALKELRVENKFLRRRLKAIEESRALWKSKNKLKAEQVKGLKKSLMRKDKAKSHQYELGLVELCVRLRQQTSCSYRSIRKIIVLLNIYFSLGLRRCPCANTIQNWVTKTGLYYLETPGSSGLMGQVCAIVDESVRLGQESMLLIVLCPASNDKREPLGHQDVCVAYLSGRESWPGDLIKESIEKVAQDFNVEIAYILSDEDTRLKKAARLLKVPHVADISHVLSTCLRKTFEKNEAYQAFRRELVYCQGKTLKQSLHYLRPAKQRLKARFMNQRGITDWGLGILNNLDKLNEQEQLCFEGLKDCRPLLEELNACLNIFERVGLLFKNEGLSQETIKKVRQVLQKNATDSSLTKKCLEYLNNYLLTYEELLMDPATSLHGCSDVIESLFGIYKDKIKNNHRAGVSQLCLELPLCCLVNEEKIQVKAALEQNSVSDPSKWISDHSADNQEFKRRVLFQKSERFFNN